MPKIEISPAALVNSIFALASAGTEETILTFTFNDFFHYLQECATISDEKDCYSKFNVPITARNGGINSRNIMYSTKKEEE